MIKTLYFLVILILSLYLFNCSQNLEEFTNAIGMRLVRISAGSFMMGEKNKMIKELGGPSFMKYGGWDVEEYENLIAQDKEESGPFYLKYGDWDEHPVHQVTIKESFYVSITEVTIDQFRLFRPDFIGSEQDSPYASGVSWYEAEAFCRWLSDKEGRAYRLPTEAEWEYVCRAGSKSLFWSGDTAPESEIPNAWGIKNTHTNVSEWCSDWYGMYPPEQLVDPIGPEAGLAKVIRGGGLDNKDPYYARSANRAGLAPNFPPVSLEEMSKVLQTYSSEENKKDTSKDKPAGFKEIHAYKSFVRNVLNNHGKHSIGFRIVQAPMPMSKPWHRELPFFHQCVKQNQDVVEYGPDPQKPYFRKRYLLPKPPENTRVKNLEDIQITGLHPGILRHNHSPALEVCSNGDILAIYYTSVSEIAPDVALMASRLRFGADQWDMPDLFLDFPDADDHAPMLWREMDTLRFFWGANKLDSGFPFQWISSLDNGASWSQVNFPVFQTSIGGHSAQPINTAFRDKNGTIFIACDGVGPESVLWVSKNNGRTWIDTGGRTGGRHTTTVLLRDGCILGMGGKSSDIEGYMPKSISADGGKTWAISKTPFCALGSNQRPTIIRLKSGRLLFAGDFQHRSGKQPRGFTQRGSYVALSEDEGITWFIKKIQGAQEHEDPQRRKDLQGETIGYAVARQAPNGLIHLITSMNEPCLHFEFNEAWILQATDNSIATEELMRPVTQSIASIQDYEEYYINGELKSKWTAGIADNGQYLLHGIESWYYENGNKQYEVNYKMGRKKSQETYWNIDGIKLWSWTHNKDGRSIWTRWWSNGNKRTESAWRNGKCEGVATRWDKIGEILKQANFVNGIPLN